MPRPTMQSLRRALVFWSAVRRCSAALAAHRKPDRKDLEAAGLDPKSFDDVRII